ncbi:isochorismate synthase MenF [Phytobacter diazotrophicus]|uniref:Isochorismate synthase MenF n=1 Tax=Phytobacter diazotrophicus TaxID=395631 RepID=A0ABM7VSI8_9ENTR|nr:isochorismate synthase MenF [Phytobacter sp. MRY16-398]BDD50045.1 menaquinone-specific isochorismate synthase [Phytobacter diazotrophicus]BEG81075.1 isochorismate synthase MenF [Phytobacter diazotrophicus]BEG86876.1 isochorismate synthase MenF [Phytobacter diazotrophicus]BEG92672.1 isochorismate synthase MenF [Phytobacter diazotrophicus]
MLSISVALEQLREKLSGIDANSPGFYVFDVAFALNDAFDPLTFLASQPCFPQFYWQQRSGEDEAAALGQVLRFPSLAEARHFLNDNPEHDLRVWGLNAFDPQQGELFLPRLEWRREGGRASLRLIVLNGNAQQNDVAQARSFIDALVRAKSLPDVQMELVSQYHFPQQSGWEALVTQATQAITRGEMDKVVLARATDYHFSQPVNAAAVMAASRRLNHHCFHFFIAFDPHNAFLGSSPERLWRRRGTSLRTEALAGTVANDTDDTRATELGDWLMNDDKNQRENMLVVEDICQRLRHATSTLDVLPPQIVRLRKVQHLRRCIWTEMHHNDDAQCLTLLQPTAAVAGLPRLAARAFITQHEPFEREWYAGSAGYLSLKQSEFCVALRCAKIRGTTVRLYAGAGIVAGSDPTMEWQEIENKAAGLRSLLIMKHV